MKSKRTPTIEEVDEKLQEIAYGPAKRPWPRSARITVWVLGILLALSAAYIGVLSCKLDDIVNSDEYIRDHILIY